MGPELMTHNSPQLPVDLGTESKSEDRVSVTLTGLRLVAILLPQLQTAGVTGMATACPFASVYHVKAPRPPYGLVSDGE